MHLIRHTRWRRATLAGAALALLIPAAPGRAESPASPPAAASDSATVAELRADLERLRADYEHRLALLESKLAVLEQDQAALAAPAPTPVPAPAATGGGQQSNTYFNPSISLIGNYLSVAGHNPVENLPNAALRESELGLQAIVDPYARGDVFLSFGEDGVEVEEGYATFTALPAQFLAKVGRMRASFGKINTLHLHVLPWADEPLPLVNLVGGEEGWKGDGVSVSKLLPIADTFTELTVQAFHPGTAGLFESDRRQNVTYNAHYRIFGDLTDASNLDFGLSYADGPNNTLPGNRTRLAGLDFTYRWKPLRTATYRGLDVRGEAVRSDREQPGGTARALGWFLSADYRLARRWWIGGRYDWSERADNEALHDSGQALVLTFSPSEFSMLRGEYRRRRYAELVTADELLLQLQFVMGAHGAHPF